MFSVEYFPEVNQTYLRLEHWRIKRPDGSYFKARFNFEQDAKEICDNLNDFVEEEAK